MKKTISLLMLALYSISVHAQKTTDNLVQLPGGVAYKILSDAKGALYPSSGDYVEMHMYGYADGKMIYNSREAMKNKPVSFVLQPQERIADIQEAIKFMTQGDSAVVELAVDSMLQSGVEKLDWMKPNTGQKMTYYIKVVTVKAMGGNK